MAPARAIHAERTFELFPVLGDVPRDTGCASAKVLDLSYRPDRSAVGYGFVDRVLGTGGAVTDTEWLACANWEIVRAAVRGRERTEVVPLATPAVVGSSTRSRARSNL